MQINRSYLIEFSKKRCEKLGRRLQHDLLWNNPKMRKATKRMLEREMAFKKYLEYMLVTYGEKI